MFVDEICFTKIRKRDPYLKERRRRKENFSIPPQKPFLVFVAAAAA
jgi:hypothetical protein